MFHLLSHKLRLGCKMKCNIVWVKGKTSETSWTRPVNEPSYHQSAHYLTGLLFCSPVARCRQHISFYNNAIQVCCCVMNSCHPHLNTLLTILINIIGLLFLSWMASPIWIANDIKYTHYNIAEQVAQIDMQDIVWFICLRRRAGKCISTNTTVRLWWCIDGVVYMFVCFYLQKRFEQWPMW